MFTKRAIFLFLIFLLVFASVKAFALESSANIYTQDEIKAEKNKCREKYGNTSASTMLAQRQCLLAIDIDVIERRQDVRDTKIQAELTKMRAQFVEFTEAMKRLEKVEKQGRGTSRQQEAETPKPRSNATLSSSPSATTPTPNSSVFAPVPAPALIGAPYMLFDSPGRYSAATWELPEMVASRVRVWALSRSVEHVLGANARLVRVLILKNGLPLAVAHPGNPMGPATFNEFFADMDHDGRPDSMTYKGIDTSFVDQVFVAYLPGDRIEIVYLVPTGRMVGINGLPPQILWGSPVRTRIEEPRGYGVWNTIAYLADRV